MLIKHPLLVIIIIGLLFRVSILYGINPWNFEEVEENILYGDSIEYNNLAKSIFQNGNLDAFGGKRTPGYPFFIAAVYYFFGSKIWAVLISQIVIDIGTLILIYYITTNVFGRTTVSLISALLYSTSVLSATYCTRMFSETIFTFIFVLGILLYLWNTRNDSIIVTFIIGALFALSTLIKPVGLYFPIILIFSIGFRKINYKKKIPQILCLVVSYLTVIGIYQYHNYLRYGCYSISDIQGTVALLYASQTMATFRNISLSDAELKLMGDEVGGTENSLELSKRKEKVAIEYILKHPVTFVKCQVKSIFVIYVATGRSAILDMLGYKDSDGWMGYSESIKSKIGQVLKYSEGKLVVWVILFKQLIEYVFVAVGFLCMLRKKKMHDAILFLFIILYFSGIIRHCGIRKI